MGPAASRGWRHVYPNLKAGGWISRLKPGYFSRRTHWGLHGAPHWAWPVDGDGSARQTEGGVRRTPVR